MKVVHLMGEGSSTGHDSFQLLRIPGTSYSSIQIGICDSKPGTEQAIAVLEDDRPVYGT